MMLNEKFMLFAALMRAISPVFSVEEIFNGVSLTPDCFKKVNNIRFATNAISR
jgi:hypothetical protein